MPYFLHRRPKLIAKRTPFIKKNHPKFKRKFEASILEGSIMKATLQKEEIAFLTVQVLKPQINIYITVAPFRQTFSLILLHTHWTYK